MNYQKKYIASCLYTLLIGIFLTHSKAHAGAFVLGEHVFWVSAEYLLYKTDHYWNKQGHKHPSFNRIKENQIDFQVEYGLTSFDTLTAWTAFGYIHETLNGLVKGLKDVEVSWRHLALNRGPHALFAQTTFIIPSGGEQANLRYGRFGVEAQLFYSRVFDINNCCAWFDSGIGYRFYFGFPSDQIRAHCYIGYHILPRVFLIAELDLDYGVFNGRKEPSQAFILLNSNYRLLQGQLEAVVRVYKHACITAKYFWHLWGENVGTGGGFQAGVSVEF